MAKAIAEKTKLGMMTRPPVVVVLGHVDHGKTTLLDYIRKTRVAEKETGGITQHIGAYTVDIPRKITFIDTPGHEAFAAMRSRGVKVADVGILVVAADEGVKPQTKEAIDILKSAKLPFAVAINKTDRAGKDIERVKKELSENGVQVESWGGNVPAVEVSAKTGDKVDELLETIVLLADLENLAGDTEAPAEGVVIESHRDPKRGATATILIRNGKLSRGNCVVIDGHASSVKILEDFKGGTIETAEPSDPVRIAGLSEVPAVGSMVKTCETKAEAEELAEAAAKSDVKPASEEVPGKSFINIVLKTDVSGSREAIEGVLASMQLPDIGIRLIRSEVGDINDSDIQLALSSSSVVIIGFKVKFPGHLAEQAKNNNVPVILGEIIYEIFDELKKTIAHLIPAEIRETVIGRLKVLKFFKQ
ncbi:MAG: GTP-binding protein [Candidatus Sungbacteria bacterium]|nr:GTP-binding protein [Candidatus Sungbacteria bacterium]